MTLETDYQALQDGAALAGGPPRGLIAVSGADRADYLQGLLTNDIVALGPGTGCYSAWLTPQGRMVTDMHVLEAGDMVLLDVPASVVAAVKERLEQFIFTEDVQIGDLTSALRAVGVHGPGAATIVQQVVSGLTDVGAWPPYRNARGALGDAPAVVARIDQFGVPGFVIYAAAESAGALEDSLLAAGALRAGDDAVAAARIEAGIPLFGADMDEEIIPLEAGIEDRAISLSKGCYVGQEVVIRVLHRGHGRVAKKLVGLRFDADAAPAAGTRLHVGDRDVGVVTSVARSPRLGAIALGYVHRDYVEPGSRVEAAGDEGSAAATVTALPFPSVS